MTDIVLNNITSGYNISKVNANFATLQDSINNDVLNLAGGNNTMGQGVDMNSHHGFNLADAVVDMDAVNLRQLLITLEQWGQGGQNGIPGASVSTQVFPWTGDGVKKDIPIPGADVSDSSIYEK